MVGGEGPDPNSVIPSTVGSGQPTTGRCDHCGTERHLREFGTRWPMGGSPQYLCHPNDGLDCYHLVTVCGEELGSRKSDPGAVSTPAPGERPTSELLSSAAEVINVAYPITHRYLIEDLQSRAAMFRDIEQ
ncbi:hypothetical protein AB0876_28890 [Mycobacterium sp. NPDC049093]